MDGKRIVGSRHFHDGSGLTYCSDGEVMLHGHQESEAGVFYDNLERFTQGNAFGGALYMLARIGYAGTIKDVAESYDEKAARLYMLLDEEQRGMLKEMMKHVKDMLGTAKAYFYLSGLRDAEDRLEAE